MAIKLAGAGTLLFGLVAVAVGLWRHLETGGNPDAVWFGIVMGAVALAGGVLILRGRNRNGLARAAVSLSCCLVLSGCATGKAGATPAPLQLVDRLDLPAFMGDWHVLGHLPTPDEEGCHNALEQYTLRDDGQVAITFSCNKHGFDGTRIVRRFTATVQNPGLNTEWRVRMKFLGFIPIKLPFLVIDLADDGSYTVIGYPSRKYLWIMARTKTLPDDVWAGIYTSLRAQAYNTDAIVRVPTR
ncbi:MAG: hypothetical protein FJW21_02810 [Acidimicrobiia bacterium]|nr:hypothetical protein [Acidimicrobiia bacterium]